MTSNLRKCIGCGDPMTERKQPRIPGVRVFQAKDRCSLCYKNAIKSGELEARERAHTTATHIKCRKCGRWKLNSMYKPHKGTVSGFEYVCRHCGKLAERYGITYEQYCAIYEAQGGLCGICPKPIEAFSRTAHVDHDHTCCVGGTSAGSSKACGNCVRGLLCMGCNVGLGMFKDSIESLKSAIEYLERSTNE